MAKFILVRHALTDAVGKKISGRTPGVHLNEEGIQQAADLAQRLSHLNVAAIYTSPLERAIETATPLAEALQLEPLLMEDLIEIDFGDWTNCSLEELRQQQAFSHFNSFRSSARIPAGELMPEAQLRIVHAMEKLVAQHGDDTVMIVSHGDVIKAAVAYYAGISLDLMQRIEISPASFTIIELYPETARIVRVNDSGKISP